DNWVVLIGVMLAGALIRHSFVSRHKAHVLGQRTPWEHAFIGVVILMGVLIGHVPRPPEPAVAAPAGAPAGVRADATAASGAAPALPKPGSFASMKAVVDQRCVLCHNANVQNKGIALDRPELIKQHAQEVFQQAVLLRNMPLNNATGITDQERDVIRQWYDGGASLN
ncbi:MAG TPA: hypothetical protein VIP05_29130, partial [Burkholderiaceae bacterium]